MVTKKKIETKRKLLFIKRCKCKQNESNCLKKDEALNKTKVNVEENFFS